MNKEFIPYEQEKELYELGFSNKTVGVIVYKKTGVNEFSFISDDFPTEWMSGILYQQAFRWFREKYNLICGVQYMGKNKINWWDIYVVGHYNIHYEEMCMKHQSYEEAELECLKKLIEIVKNK